MIVCIETVHNVASLCVAATLVFHRVVLIQA